MQHQHAGGGHAGHGRYHGHTHGHSHSGSHDFGSNRAASPARTHDDPWAHPFICCDMDHAASTSTGPSTTASPMVLPTPPNAALPSVLLPSVMSSGSTPKGISPACPMDMYVCEENACVDQHSTCCVDPSCGATEPCSGSSHTHTQENSGECTGLEELEAWACTKEGCHAIQQYLDCCNQLECDTPVLAEPSQTPHASSYHQHAHSHSHAGSVHTPHNTPIFDPPTNEWTTLPQQQQQQQQQQFTPVSHTNSPLAMLPSAATPMMPTHVCHWQNCHRVFTSMPDLLGHVASDHLGAPGFLNETTPKMEAPLPQILIQPLVLPDSMQAFSSATSSSNPPMSTSLSQPSAPSVSTMNAFPTGNSNPFDNLVGQELLSCLWDDCLPMPECTAPAPEACPTHANMPAHPMGGHTHNSITGEPFSPQTMLRHVLEEHLGVPGSILGWGDTSQIPPTTHNTISQAHDRLHFAQRQQQGLLLTPSSTQQSPSPPPVKQLICLWPGCTHPEPFVDPASLMAHLSDCHVGKGKDSYTCLWDGCDRAFRSRQKVLRHLQSHTGHRPFVCPECEQAFGEAAPLAAHMRRHAQEKPFKCDYPGCGKTFAISSSLTIHMRTHNGEKPFVCPHCGKGFVEASNLTKHIRTHTGERPFACAFPGCGKRFPRPDQLKRHMGVHDNGTVKGRRGSKAKVEVEGEAS